MKKIIVLLAILMTSCSNLYEKTPDRVEEKKSDVLVNDTFEKSDDYSIIDQIITNASKSENSVENQDDTQEETEVISSENKIEDIFNQELFKNSNLSYFVKNLNSNEIVAEKNSEQIIIPASMLKIITAATSYEYFGKDYIFKTNVYTNGKVDSTGTLNGNIYIVGSGDPSLGSFELETPKEEFVKKWIDELKRKNIKKINGDIVVVQKRMISEGNPLKWEIEDLGTNYGAGIYGFTVFDNLYNITLKSDNKSVKVLETFPKISGLKYEKLCTIDKNKYTKIKVRSLPNSMNKGIYGNIQPNTNRLVVKSDITNPAKFFGEYFKEKLENNGIQTLGGTKTSYDNLINTQNFQMLASYSSPKLEKIIKILLKNSNNNYTEHLFQLLKLEKVDIIKYWKEKGIDISGLYMADGSGLSRSNFVTTKTLVEILEKITGDYPEFSELLPIAGREGTVSEFLPKEKFLGKANIKTGSMSNIQGYCGFIEKDNQKYVFAICVNYWKGKRKDVVDDMEKFLINITK